MEDATLFGRLQQLVNSFEEPLTQSENILNFSNSGTNIDLSEWKREEFRADAQHSWFAANQLLDLVPESNQKSRRSTTGKEIKS